MKNNIPRVQNMKGKNGREVVNQFEIFTDDSVYFQSYSSIIAIKLFNGAIILDKENWNYSRTTAKYRNMFLRETTKETEAKIKNGLYQLADLN